MLNEEIIDQQGRDFQMSIFDNSNRARFALIAFGVNMVISLIYFLSTYMQLNLLENIQLGGPITESEADFNDSRQSIVAIMYFISSILTMVFFLMWFKKAYENINNVGIESTNYSVWSSVWSWIVPILSLFRPVQIMTEISTKTQDAIQHFDETFKIKSFKALIGIWWASFIITNIIDQVFNRISNNSDNTIQSNITISQNEMISAAITIPEIAIVMFLILRVSNMEKLLQNKVLENGGYLAS